MSVEEGDRTPEPSRPGADPESKKKFERERRELPTERITTADERGRRIWLYVADVRGFFRRLRTQIGIFLLFIFLVLPWIRIAGNPAILLDIPGRRFSVLGILFWAHDGPMLLFLLGIGLLGLALLTSVLGRVWCGYGCPQTVFIDLVFRPIERWIEGNPVERKRLNRAPWTLQKVGKKSLKWAMYTVSAIVIAHSFLAYFVGTHRLAVMVRTSPIENPTTFLFMIGIVAVILFDFAWFREQFCLIVCPYGRFQSVLMDEDSMVVAYDRSRGEPRKVHGPSSTNELPRESASLASPLNQTRVGDCVSCNRCIDVCPTGIDIRRGVQMECIACTSCMDACDEVMKRFNKPTGLIRYDSLAFSKNQEATQTRYRPRIRLRGWVYLSMMTAFGIGLAYTVSTRTPASVMLIRAVGAPYQVLSRSDGTAEVVNQFRVDIQSQTQEDLKIELLVDPSNQSQDIVLVRSLNADVLKAGQSERSNLFVKVPKSFLTLGHGQLWLRVVGRSSDGKEVMSLPRELKIVGPLK